MGSVSIVHPAGGAPYICHPVLVRANCSFSPPNFQHDSNYLPQHLSPRVSQKPTTICLSLLLRTVPSLGRHLMRHDNAQEHMEPPATSRKWPIVSSYCSSDHNGASEHAELAFIIPGINRPA